MRKSVYKDIFDFLKQVNPGIQGKSLQRLEVLSSLVCSCLVSKNCSLESLSQANGQGGTEKKNSLLQQTKRWLSNKWVDMEMSFLPFARHFLQPASLRGELVLVVDGTQTGHSHTTLMLSVLHRSFAVPLFWVVRKGEKGHFPEQMHMDLFRAIHPVLPAGCRVVVLGDGEYDGINLQKLFAQYGWEFVVRTSCDRKIDCGGEVGRMDALSPAKGHDCLFVLEALPGVNALCWHEKRFEKPIFLLTNMELAKMACHYYKQRFCIETMFKQLKSRGFQLHKTQLQDAAKIARLVIVVAIAFTFAYGIGRFLKEHTPVEQLECIVRKDKIKHLDPIFLAKRCCEEKLERVLAFFSELSGKFIWVFT